MPIVSSLIVSQVPQVDGRISVTERHRDHNGVDHDVVYLAPADMELDAVLSARAIKMGAEIDRREAIEAESLNFELPISQVNYVRRFTTTERHAIYAATKTNVEVEDFWNMLLLATGGVHLSAPEVQAGLQLFEQAGLIASGRAAVIGNPNG
jgi:hypothetical protein